MLRSIGLFIALTLAGLVHAVEVKPEINGTIDNGCLTDGDENACAFMGPGSGRTGAVPTNVYVGLVSSATDTEYITFQDLNISHSAGYGIRLGVNADHMVVKNNTVQYNGFVGVGVRNNGTQTLITDVVGAREDRRNGRHEVAGLVTEDRHRGGGGQGDAGGEQRVLEESGTAAGGVGLDELELHEVAENSRSNSRRYPARGGPHRIGRRRFPVRRRPDSSTHDPVTEGMPVGAGEFPRTPGNSGLSAGVSPRDLRRPICITDRPAPPAPPADRGRPRGWLRGSGPGRSSGRAR